MRSIVTFFDKWVLRRPLLTFVAMCTAFGLFGAGTLNIFHMFSDNWDALTSEGLMSFDSASVFQLLYLILTLIIAMFFYTLFKICEYAMIQHFQRYKNKD